MREGDSERDWENDKRVGSEREWGEGERLTDGLYLFIL